MHPNAPIIRRNGEVNAWDNAEFRAAVKATGKKQIIVRPSSLAPPVPINHRSIANYMD